jgi:Protein of unknown function (DUF1553)/Protein of unknown function (DUF1549)/Planctomycete cytochrome C
MGADGDSGTKATTGPAFPRESIEFFESRVRPILVDRCFKCHGEKKQSNGLRLDSREAALKGGDTGPALVAGKPDESLLIQAVAQTHAELKMPPSGKLPDAAVATLRQWVALGAPWPTVTAASRISGVNASQGTATHWAFAPIKRVVPPAVKDPALVQAPLDAFVMARLEAAGLEPSRRASRRTLIRRATIDLWGIPPTAAEVEAFEAEQSPDAFARLVDRLLASPRYGERWGRHWLDVARYADTKGYVFTQDRRYPYAYTYRDYVVEAFNADLGYDQFVVQQLAADHVTSGKDRGPLAAMGFLTVGRRFLLDQNEIIDDRIDVVTRGFLGLTVTCARCHDHKFDPIPSEDYYSLYGVFASSMEPAELPMLADPTANPRFAEYQQKLAVVTKARDDYLAARRDEFAGDMKARLSQYIMAAQSLGFDPRSRKLDEQARAGGLNARRLRGVMSIWRRHVSAVNAKDPVFGPWRSFEALPADQFKAKAAELHRAFSTAKGAAAPVHPLVAKAVLASPPSSMADVVERYSSLLAQLETRWKDHTAKSKPPASAVLPEADWESLRKAIFEAGGALAVNDEGMRFILDQSQRARFEKLNGAIQQLNASDPASPARAMVMNDLAQPVNPHVFLRGNPGRPGPEVPRRFLKVLSGSDRPAFRKGSGRLELAQAVASPGNPLTARVLVNRAWLWHFGKGLVGTPSDFGLRSDPPSHPELLDYLAAEFIASGWSIKGLQRRIMLTSTYQQQSEPRPDGLARDPENRLLWRFNRQRLDFESMRDSVLAVAGSLGPDFGGPSSPLESPAFSLRRTLYGLIDRQNLDGVYRTFDFAVPDATSPRRFVTTVPQQALFLMNSPFLHEQARRLSREILLEREHQGGSDPELAVRLLYRRVLGRLPDDNELALARAFVRGQANTWRPAQSSGGEPQLSPWEQLSQVVLLTNEFMFVD